MCAISTGFCTGPSACFSRLGARPSQNCTVKYAELNTVGALRVPVFPCTPLETGLPSENPALGLWHVAHETVLSTDNCVS